MHLHILGISGTFMSALALLAREAGFTVTGSDANCYPPISDLLEAKGIDWVEGYDDASMALKADCIIVGNAIKRGMPVLEAILDADKPYTSGPQWLAEHILSRYRVLAVAGTHGKTTTTSMLAHILDQAGLEPGFLIGGVAPNFNTSNRLGKGKWFVIEADEYDSAYFDKRPKLMHYRPEIALLNNLEFDHADIYANLEAIQQQFHYYLKTIPAKGIVLKPRDDAALNAVVEQGVFSRLEELALNGDAQWRAELLEETGRAFRVWHHGKIVAEVNWPLIGRFNVENGLAAIAASSHTGVNPVDAARALESFRPVKRRLEVKSDQNGITVYDDFAHHPTAISKTIHALKNSQRHKRITVVLEFASYTMKMGVHGDKIRDALQEADNVIILKPQHFNLDDLVKSWNFSYKILPTSTEIVNEVATNCQAGDAILVMSNRGFDNIHQQLTAAIAQLG
ncbi:UDP-N-acetylmuramate-L-alanyl-gamma-D-glutamyl- meso-diaminopimelate ligase [Legionella quinlivanii]|uniref:UDP-N-acetylmuramate:L-alanyl-gamma-D-glutamyl-meso-diaminopimelate ligase n=1 Tax=Legionella quinlivanii TaxID=45073 RepID=A0A0W0XWS2_9GAMM|nr:UDP-N-acetylmuramate:L-alanyl-gamma-D-glutamyl-meso-diaminopimelate ligase [Legionella quinlivanii]KTD49148.1 UDP-N-acetylmuramate-L-alanyl-gamma-D-glutamyl- meso-diaminopimelate ligase [Legionella quinlivanii]MCW8450194.1 UDP-N-acetylmuramate:L-alanyl-gamma-D-glutamyl-meso-diaminopimelate ligase [Legionella quinlivanii]SEG42997.1 UDP-N-acetylmuramate: L-alanyl-gamma-D-glutamyl-meso-diaminopimelate ligase [Legionella quinlivanii DSM 21216]STY11658.1 UDP-N-acetylmuramate-L-alanyl-gamma-D-glut